MSLSENLHNLGTLLKTNLETKGINGLTGNEGLTTLANKILDIEGSSSSSKSVVAHITGNNVTIGKRNSTWLIANDATINWGDGTSNTVDNPQETLSHTYTDGVNEHLIALDGTITGLGIDCFYGCTGLTSIFIPNSITSLGNNCFIDCSGLTSVIIPNSVTSLGTSCFRECSNLINVIIPNSITSLGNNCFDGCSSLTNVVIPNSITSLGTSCFDGCSSLTSIIVPNSVTSLGTSCFKWCSGLTSVVIPNSVTSLGDECFFECSGLTSVTIPSSVTSLGDWCFHNCDALIDYQLYWTGNNIITYDSSTMPNNTDTIFTIPSGETSNYTSKGYPTSKLVERGESLTLTCDKPIIQKTETSTVTATLKQSGSPLTGKTLNYQVKHGNTVISSGTKTTNSSGQATISYVGTGVGDVDIVVSYGTLLQETYEIKDCLFCSDGTSMDSEKWNADSTLNVSADSTGKSIVATGNGWYSALTDTKQQMGWTGDLTIEFDVISITGTVRFGIVNNNSNLVWITPTVGHYVRTVSLTELYRIGFRLGADMSIKFKNFVIYKIVDYDLTLSSDKDILSAHDGESATITALLTEDNVPTEDTELEYSIKHDNTVIDSGTITTNSNGEANIVYTATGVGDVDIIVSYGTLLQETYEVEDTFFYDDATTDKSSIYDVANRIILNRNSAGTVTLAHNNNKYDITAFDMGNYGLINIPSLTGVNKPFELSMDIISMSSDFGLQLNNTNGKFIMGVPQSEMFRIPYTSNITTSDWGVEGIQPASIFNNIKLVCQFNGNTMNVKVYDNNNGNTLYNYTSTLASSLNNETNTVNYGLIMYNGSFSFKNLKVKAL